MKHIKLLTIIFFVYCNLSAQTVYEFKYNLKNNANSPDCSAFFLKYDNGEALCRIRYNDVTSKQLVLLEMRMQEKPVFKGKEIDPEKTLYTAIEGTQIINDISGIKLDTSVAFLFVYNNVTTFNEPSAVLAPGFNEPMPDGKSKFEYVQLDRIGISKKFLAKYFNEFEPLFAELISSGAKGLTPEEKNIKMWMVVVANIKDSAIGQSCAMDRDKILRTFKDVASYLGITKMDTVIISGANYNKEEVGKAIDRIKPNKNDIVIFYYSGHGYRVQGDGHKFPWMDLRYKPGQRYMIETLNIEDIYTKIVAKPARLNLVISDCCNSDVQFTNAIGSKPSSSGNSKGLNLPNEDNCRKLFLNKTRASYLFTAADYGQRATSNNNFGGFFTFFFIAWMEYNTSVLGKKEQVSWDDVFENAYKKTVEKADNTCCDKPCVAANACVQNPIRLKKIGN